MNHTVQTLISLNPVELPEELRAIHASIAARVRAVLVDSEEFMKAFAQVREGQLEIDWERAKAACRKQREVMERAVQFAGSIESRLPAQHRAVGEAVLAVKNYQAVPDRYATVTEIQAIKTERDRLESAVTAAQKELGVLEGELTQARGWELFESERMREAAEAEARLADEVGLSQNPNAPQFNSFGLSTSRPATVTVANFGLS